VADLVGNLAQITAVSLYVSGASTLLAAAIGVPLGAYIAMREFAGRGLVKAFTYTLYGFPPVLAGLLVYMALSRQGPLGALGLLYTPPGMILAQTLLIVPLITGVTITAVSGVDREVRDTARALGAEGWPLVRTVLAEARKGVVTAVMVGFGRAISEVGAVLMVGGNLSGETQVLTTAIYENTRLGEFSTAIAIGLLLLAISFLIFFLLFRFQERAEDD